MAAGVGLPVRQLAASRQGAGLPTAAQVHGGLRPQSSAMSSKLFKTFSILFFLGTE